MGQTNIGVLGCHTENMIERSMLSGKNWKIVISLESIDQIW